MVMDMRPIYWTVLAFARTIVSLLWWPRYIGRENVPAGPLLICSNHRSWFDPPLVSLAVPREIGFLAKAELFKNFFFGRLIWAVNARPIRRGTVDRAAVEHITNHLKNSIPVLVFPEGTRSRTGSMQPPRPGVGMLARQCDVPILPVYITGSFRMGRRPFAWRRVQVRLGTPIPREEIERFPDDKDGYRALSRRIIEAICALSDDPKRDLATALAEEP
jgi:1-acyl-sn-glycerol-3-phosphate acyltransferase